MKTSELALTIVLLAAVGGGAVAWYEKQVIPPKDQAIARLTTESEQTRAALTADIAARDATITARQAEIDKMIDEMVGLRMDIAELKTQARATAETLDKANTDKTIFREKVVAFEAEVIALREELARLKQPAEPAAK